MKREIVIPRLTERRVGDRALTGEGEGGDRLEEEGNFSRRATQL